MNTKFIDTFTQVLDAVVTEFERLQATPLLTADVLEVLRREVQASFFAGWEARHGWGEALDSMGPMSASPAPMSTSVASPSSADSRMGGKVGDLVEVDSLAWVEPLAIVEDVTTGERFIDPRFPLIADPSDRYCVVLMMTEEGLVAAGPDDLHRLSPVVARDQLRPLARYDVETEG